MNASNAAGAPAIEVRHLVKRYGTVNAVQDLSFTVPTGSITALLGGNGAGKTTTLAILLGVLLPTAGEARVLGVDILKHRYRVLPRMNFGSPYVELPKRLSVRENLMVFAQLYGVRRPQQRIDSLTETLQMGEFIRRPTGTLSAGQKTRASLAKALVNEPEVLLLDEPTASLDPDTGDWVRAYLERYVAERKATILLASHNMSEVERMASFVLMMKAGKLVDRGTAAELLKKYGREDLEEVFLDIARDRRRAEKETVA
jgi:ABC-2 type transport system ATP-binding protein